MTKVIKSFLSNKIKFIKIMTIFMFSVKLNLEGLNYHYYIQ